MHKLFLLAFFLITLSSNAQLRSPQDFLGYTIGERFTPHWRVVEYMRHVATAVPTMVKLQQYGQTNEGRPLMIVIVSSAANLQNIEAIRTNNMRLASQASGSADLSATIPIVWLSYNVHGNEASSTEAAMLTLHSLVDPSNQQTKTWLQNTVVIIDPCLNPDGRDRYVNWYTSMAGSRSNPNPDAREHYEPWSPGGRTNHYYFDLNRDWAWQTQVETQQRMKVYNEWLPQVHVDFHEQWPESPYYFAPAAQPYHEVITPWQRDFQNTIGRNHARYFDREGWLYFTKEYFDLLYPSYGDTYPIFNGAIGMTYEQAGHSFSGGALLLESGDTLTLKDRALHHYTTSLSTIEVSSQNASKLVREFANYFSDAVKNGVGEYKSFVIRHNARDSERFNALIKLLDANRIQYGNGRAASLKGYNYHTGKEETFNLASNDLVIPTNQAKGHMVKVLFEPNTTVVDSNTYDITAWALPYAYGLSAFAVRTTIATSSLASSTDKPVTPTGDPYGYVVAWNGMKSVRFVADLLKNDIRVRFSENAFEINGKAFDRGSLIIVRTSNQRINDFWNVVRAHAADNGVELIPVNTGFADRGFDFGSSKIHLLRKPNVALITGPGTSANGSGEIWHFFDKVIDYPLTLINLTEYSSVDWGKYDVIIMPNGNYAFLNDKAQADRLREWVSRGGKLIALENSINQLARTDWSIKAKKRDESTDTTTYSALRIYENRERDFIPNNIPGSIYKVELDNTHPLAFGYPNYYYTLKQDDALYDFIRENGWNVGIIRKNNQVSGFVGSKLKNRLQDSMLFGVQEIGSGQIVYLVDNLLFRGFWENGKLMFSNAVFLVGQ